MEKFRFTGKKDGYILKLAHGYWTTAKDDFQLWEDFCRIKDFWIFDDDDPRLELDAEEGLNEHLGIKSVYNRDDFSEKNLAWIAESDGELYECMLQLGWAEDFWED